MRLIVNRDRCIGAGQCVLSTPELFDQSDDDGQVLLTVGPPAADTTETAEKARTAVYLCPSGALALADDPTD